MSWKHRGAAFFSAIADDDHFDTNSFHKEPEQTMPVKDLLLVNDCIGTASPYELTHHKLSNQYFPKCMFESSQSEAAFKIDVSTD